MDKIIKLIAILVLFASIGTVHAQKTKALSIGDKLPELVVKNFLDGKPDRVDLADLKGKIVLIDFWATWCSPCVASMPFLDSLQSSFPRDIQVICVTSETDTVVRGAYHRLFPTKKPSFLTLTQDTLLRKYFPHQTIPHCIWIDRDGTIRAVTDKSALTVDNIGAMVAGNRPALKIKPALIPIDNHRPTYAAKQVVLKDEFLYHSLVTRYREDLKIRNSRGPKDDYIVMTNSPIVRLYQCAVGKFNLSWLDMNRVVCRGFETFADSAAIGLFQTEKLTNTWLSNMKDYAFSYELAISDTVFSTTELFEIMQQDLNRYFGIYGLRGTTEMGSHKIMALTILKGKGFRSFTDTTGRPEKYADAGFLKAIDQTMSYFLSQLLPYLGSGKPLLNQTGYQGKVNISLEIGSKDLDGVNRGLAEYGLKIIEKEEPIEVLVMTKTNGRKKFPEPLATESK